MLSLTAFKLMTQNVKLALVWICFCFFCFFLPFWPRRNCRMNINSSIKCSQGTFSPVTPWTWPLRESDYVWFSKNSPRLSSTSRQFDRHDWKVRKLYKILLTWALVCQSEMIHLQYWKHTHTHTVQQSQCLISVKGSELSCCWTQHWALETME